MGEEGGGMHELMMTMMIDTNDNPPNNVRVALTSAVVAVVANSGWRRR